MTHLKTTIIWSDDDPCFIADVPELPGYMAHVVTPETALAAAKDQMHHAVGI